MSLDQLEDVHTIKIPTDLTELTGWAKTCYGEISVIFDSAHDGIEPFVEAELLPLGKNVLRSLDLRMAFLDTASLGLFAADKARKVDRPLLLPSEQAMARSFERWCMGPATLDMFLIDTFNLLGDALARRHGHAMASELVDDCWDAFEPVRLEAVRRLIVGPEKLRAARSPAQYFATLGLWAGTWLLVGGWKARVEDKKLRELAKSMTLLGYPPQNPLPPRRHLRRVGASMGMSVVGAGIANTALNHTVKLVDLYTEHLEGIEDVVLFGADQRKPEQRFGPGLLNLVAAVDRFET